MNSKAAASVLDTSFTLDEAVLAQRKAASAQRLHTLQIPALRTLGFAILCAIVALNDWRSGAPFPQPELVLLVAANLAYAAAAWLLLRAGYGSSGPVHLSMVLFHLDVLMWLPNLHRLEHGGQLFFAYFLLVRVVDQVGVGFRRALYFCAVVTVAYLGYSAWISAFEPASAHWGERLGIAATMALLGLYIAATGLVTERLRLRTREAIRTARSLLGNLEQKATALEAQADELDQARRLAEQASLAKSQFLAVASHELRTPMNGILGAAELLIATPLSQTQQHYVRIAHRSATALLALIDDVLDLSRIESGQLTLRPEAVDLCGLVDEALDLVAITARGKPVVLSCNVSRRAPMRVLADPQRLRQLLVNLLHNAVKFTEQGSVELRVEPIGDTPRRRVRFSVRDTGIGIPEDQLSSIFDAFTQVDGSTTRRHGGSGLGLAIVKELAERMGGEARVESTPGVGSHFWVDLPLAEVAGVAARLDADRDDAEPAPPSLAVLAADDDPVNQLVVEEMLKALGCEVDVVADGEQALQAALRKPYDIVFMDCHMPVMDGYEATRRIRAGERSARRRTPIVALTADSLSSDRDRCLAAGMDDFMTKPISSSQLSSTIERWTGQRTYPATQW